MIRIPSRSRQSGFTLIEMLIVGVVFGALLGSVALIGSSGQGAFEAGAARSDLDVRVRRGVDRVAFELMTASRDSLDYFAEVPFWDDEVIFDQVTAVSELDGSLVTSPARIVFEYETGEADDGADTNGNGVSNEGDLVMYRNWGLAEQQRVVLSGWVREYAEGETGNGDDDNENDLTDERGLCFSRIGDVLTISLCLERPDSDGRPLARTLTTSIWLRN